MTDQTKAFMDVTGVASESEAAFYLESHGGNLESAIAMFFEGNPPPATAPTPTLAAPVAAAPSTSRPAPASTSRIATLGQSADKDEKQNLYAGGAKSGMYVQNPDAPKENVGGMIEAILKKAAETGAGMHNHDEDDDEDDDSAGPSSSARPAFGGQGFTLGSDDTPSRTVGESILKKQGEDEVETNDGKVTREMTFWKDGFSIEDGPLMRYDDPANAKLLEQIMTGRAPLSLFGLKFGQRADVRVIQRKEEAYVPPKKVVKPFAGEGNRLGSHVPSSSTAPVASTSAAPAAVSKKIIVDPTKPATTIQLRLADGTRMVAHFNLDHTVADIRGFINSSRPGEGVRAYGLQTQFPTKVLDDKATIEEAQLKNAVVFQKY